jgi:3-oxoacyl-[acyl-carrier protein] reductase
MFELHGRVGLVTGGGRGIGRAIALTLARQGADVAVVDLEQARAESVAGEVRGQGRRAVAHAGDVAEFRAAAEAVEATVRSLGALHILVNNAGIGQPSRFHELTEAEWDRVLGVHLKGSFNFAKAAAAHMQQAGWGRIVSISSMNAKYGGGPYSLSRTAYAAAKAGILGLTRGLAKELAPTITANAICPGLTETDLTRSLTHGERRERLLADIPLGRFGRPEDMAAAVAFLVSEEAGYITGEVVDVNGGLYVD